jgi:hypothetical protein
MAKGDTEGALASLPSVTCLERAAGPGGVWRSERSFQEDEKKEAPPGEARTNMCK